MHVWSSQALARRCFIFRILQPLGSGSRHPGIREAPRLHPLVRSHPSRAFSLEPRNSSDKLGSNATTRITVKLSKLLLTSVPYRSAGLPLLHLALQKAQPRERLSSCHLRREEGVTQGRVSWSNREEAKAPCFRGPGGLEKRERSGWKQVARWCVPASPPPAAPGGTGPLGRLKGTGES